MKRYLTVLASTAALVGALFTGLTFAHAQTTNPVAPPAGAGLPQSATIPRQSAIFRAIKALESAKLELANSGHNFGGHKDDALQACDKAITQLQLALETAKK